MRISPDFIDSLEENEIFVFGSNLSGIHGAGAAKQAMGWGAVWGQSEGLQGKTYAIPTKDKNVYTTLPLPQINSYVKNFIEFARKNPHLKFLVTEIGCGLAGYVPAQIAPLFIESVDLENVFLPQSFLKFYDRNKS